MLSFRNSFVSIYRMYSVTKYIWVSDRESDCCKHLLTFLTKPSSIWAFLTETIKNSNITISNIMTFIVLEFNVMAFTTVSSTNFYNVNLIGKYIKKTLSKGKLDI